jgi:hypothetical protein
MLMANCTSVQLIYKPHTPKPDRPQPDRPAAYIIGLYFVSDVMDSVMYAGLFPKCLLVGSEEGHDFSV